jgi:hypothetical protein
MVSSSVTVSVPPVASVLTSWTSKKPSPITGPRKCRPSSVSVEQTSPAGHEPVMLRSPPSQLAAGANTKIALARPACASR